MNELLDKFESRMNQELSLNPTQTAHARQILSDLMDVLEPQQPVEGKPPDLLETARRVRDCMNNLVLRGELIDASDNYELWRHRAHTEQFQPRDWIAVGAKAQLADMRSRWMAPEEVKKLRLEITELADKAERIRDEMKTMVKLPSEDELALWLCDHLDYTSQGLAQELLRLLSL